MVNVGRPYFENGEDDTPTLGPMAREKSRMSFGAKIKRVEGKWAPGNMARTFTSTTPINHGRED